MSREPTVSGPVLRSERLELRPFCNADVDELLTIFTDAEVRRWLLDDQIVSRAWVEGEVRDSIRRFEAGSAGLWTLRLLAAPEPQPPGERISTLIGFVGFRHFFEPPELQLLYGLLPEHWGRGFATEAARAAVAFAFDRLGHAEVRAATDTPNTESIAVMRRLGMTELRRSDDGPHGTVFFRMASTD